MAYEVTMSCNQCTTEAGMGLLWTGENNQQISFTCPRCGGDETVGGYTMEKTNDSPEQYTIYDSEGNVFLVANEVV